MREFPRVPFYSDFATWAAWGRQLLDLHIGYEQAPRFALVRTDTPDLKRAEGSHPRPKLKSIPESGTVVVDEDTQLGGIPLETWAYRLEHFSNPQLQLVPANAGVRDIRAQLRHIAAPFCSLGLNPTLSTSF